MARKGKPMDKSSMTLHINLKDAQCDPLELAGDDVRFLVKQIADHMLNEVQSKYPGATYELTKIDFNIDIEYAVNPSGSDGAKG